MNAAFSFSDRLSILPGCENPLSSDAAAMEGDRCRYLYDVGSRPEMLAEILQNPRPTVVILSHFHPDHRGNLPLFPEAELLVSPHSFRYIGRGRAVEEPIEWTDGLRFRLLPLASAHAKGCLALEINGEAMLVGDAFCPSEKGGHLVYNVQALAAQLALLKESTAEWVLLGHRMDRPCPKEELILKLKTLYARRHPGDPWVEAEEMI